MKKLFLSMVVVMIATMSYAQSSVLATLSHNGEISTYYGATALKEAHDAAEHGDVITLSSGSFQAVDITKAVTIRGAGMQTDSIAKIYPSHVVGDFVINVADTLEQRLTVEGIYFNNKVSVYNKLKNATFVKSRFNEFTSIYGSDNGYGFMINLTFIHCKIASYFNNRNGGNSVSFVNSVIMNPAVGDYTNNSFEFTNCVVKWTRVRLNGIYTHPSSSSYYAIYRNCIISTLYSFESDVYFPNTNMAYNCLGICSYNMFKNLGTLGNNMVYTTANMSDVFKTWTGEYNDAENFELTEDAKRQYPGDDGKEVGLYGGNLPFSPNPTNPKITKFNVASKSTADGKLSVDIEVKAAE